MCRLIIESYVYLIRIEILLRSQGLQAIHALVRNRAVSPVEGGVDRPAKVLANAMDLACAFSLKQILCLQRSAATVLLMRRHGHRAEMVIGTQVFPFRSHAWVEIDGVVVNDKPYMTEIYLPLERC